MDEENEGLGKLFQGLALLTLIIAAIVLVVIYSGFVGKIFGYIGYFIGFIFMMMLVAIPVLGMIGWVDFRVGKKNINPSLVIFFGLPILFIAGIVFTIGISWTYPGIGDTVAPFICLEGYTLKNIGSVKSTGVSFGGNFQADISGTLCSDGQRKAYPWRYAYPWIMILLFLFVSMTILVATEFDAAVLRGRFTERRRKQMLYIFGVVVIAILVFLPPPIDLLALAIHPFFF